jgi:hypothetical protein
MVHPLLLHEHTRPFRKCNLEAFERSGLALERNEGPPLFLAYAQDLE